MLVSPIIDRELRVALRSQAVVKSRFKVAARVGGFVALFLFLGWVTHSRQLKMLEQLLFFFGLYAAIIPAARISVGLFCEERRNQTLELLYLSGISSEELFLGKLSSGALIASSDLLAIAPFLAVPFLNGGLSLNLFLAMIACFPIIFLFVTAVGVVGSVLCRDEGAALVAAIVVGGVICVALPLPFFLGHLVTGALPFSTRWLCLSPAYAPYLVQRNFAGGSVREFWLTAGVTLVWSLACLITAAAWLNRNWRDAERVVDNSRGWRAWLHGSKTWRENLRARLMSENAFQWLAQQDRRPLLLAWGLIGMVVTLWLMGWCAWPGVWPTPVNLYLTALLLLLGTGWIMVYAAAQPLARERAEGSLELLLTTPLAPAEIVDGQIAAVRAQFKQVRRVLVILFFIMALGGLLTRKWTTPALVSYWCIWACLMVITWRNYTRGGGVPRSMWVGLNTGRPMYALWYNQNRRNQKWSANWWWIWMFFNLRSLWGGLTRAGRFPTGSVIEVTIVVIVSVLMCLVIFAATSATDNMPLRDRLIAEMRLIARLPLPSPKDPRFKQWTFDEQSPLAARMQTFTERVGGKLGGGLGRQWGRWQRLRRGK